MARSGTDLPIRKVLPIRREIAAEAYLLECRREIEEYRPIVPAGGQPMDVAIDQDILNLLDRRRPICEVSGSSVFAPVHVDPKRLF